MGSVVAFLFPSTHYGVLGSNFSLGHSATLRRTLGRLRLCGTPVSGPRYQALASQLGNFLTKEFIRKQEDTCTRIIPMYEKNNFHQD